SSPSLARVARETLQVAHDEAVHRRGVEGGGGELLAAGVLAGPKERPFLELGLGHVIGDRLGGGEMDADGATSRPFLVDPNGRAVGVVVDVLDAEPAAGGETGPGIRCKVPSVVGRYFLTPTRWFRPFPRPGASRKLRRERRTSLSSEAAEPWRAGPVMRASSQRIGSSPVAVNARCSS